MPQVLKGAAAADAITADLINRNALLREKGIIPKLAILRIGENPSDLSYERGALKRAARVGAEVQPIVLPEDAPREMILDAIDGINRDRDIHGALIFRPFKDKETEVRAAALLDPAKDLDCMTLGSQAGVYTGTKEGFAPCTAQAVMEIMKHYGIKIAGRKAVVVGRSLVIGKPVAMMLLQENATVTICHSKSADLKSICRSADIIVAAVGRAGMLDEEYMSEGQTVIDVGINVGPDGSLMGDADENAKARLAGAYTPVPGGVGAVTTAVLFKHLTEAAERAL